MTALSRGCEAIGCAAWRDASERRASDAEAEEVRLSHLLGELGYLLREQEALALRSEARAETAEAEVERLRAELVAIDNDDEEHALYQRVKKGADAAMRSALGECWNHLWGWGLEELGRVVEAGMLHAARVEVERDDALAEVAKLRAALDATANDEKKDEEK